MSGQREVLLDLLERVKDGIGPDGELDGAIFDALVGVDAPDAKRWYGGGWVADVSGSLDGALAFLGRAFPGALWAVGSMEEGPFCQLVVPNKNGDYIGGDVRESAQSAPRSVTAAVLRAAAIRAGGAHG